MQKEEKERVVEQLAERLRSAETLIVADYRGLTMPQIDGLRAELSKHGARFQVVKNTLTRRAAEAAGADALLPLLEGPSAIAFIESEGDPAAVAKALAAAVRETRVLEIRGGVMQARTLTAADVDELAKLPPFDVLRGQVLGAIVAPLTAFVGLVSAPLQSLHGLIDARIEQLGGAAPEPADEPVAPVAEPVAPAAEEEAAEEAPPEEPAADAGDDTNHDTSPPPEAAGEEEQ